MLCSDVIEVFSECMKLKKPFTIQYETFEEDTFDYEESWDQCEYCLERCENDDCNGQLTDEEYTQKKHDGCTCVPAGYYG